MAETTDTTRAQTRKKLKLEELGLGPGKRVRLHRLLYTYGVGNGTLLLLPLDQGLEHGPRDFFPNPPSEDPSFQVRLAKEGGYSGLVLQIGLAKKHIGEFAGEVPLVLKLNGKTDIPSDDEAFSPLTASVEEAVALGADAVGYTLYVGSPAQDRDLLQFREVRAEADRLGMPVIVWAYPRGEAIEKKGGRDSLYAIDYAARVACELGADVIKLNLPVANPERDKESPAPYNRLSLSPTEAMAKVVRSAGKTPVILSGGSRMEEEDLMEKARAAMDAGAIGLIFGRNLWQRPYDQALTLTHGLKALLLHY